MENKGDVGQVNEQPTYSSKDESRPVFEREMVANGWEAQRDLFGAIYRWRSVESGKVVDDSFTHQYWYNNNKLPAHERIPF